MFLIHCVLCDRPIKSYDQYVLDRLKIVNAFPTGVGWPLYLICDVCCGLENNEFDRRQGPVDEFEAMIWMQTH